MARESRNHPDPAPDFTFETAAIAAGRLVVAGVDEAGRGPLAGPVVTAAVILDPGRIPQGLNDSKKLTAERREELHAIILATAEVAVAIAPPSVIALRNIRGATLWAMRQAVLGLCRQPAHVLVDGRDVPPGLPCPAEAVIGGDGISVSIAAASIVAKVTRDRMCQIMDCDEPLFGFHGHKGYGTPEHLSALFANGPGRHHRLAFAPCAEALRLRASA
ncbi:ribonuclease HII [Arsenicitalea aurantiaca]|uniref:Ribonuclease HII n=1 Tax=Arsenicitalea aurantiaca TaxID=1783274 RepID=A0A433XAR6_9HYPH|nr:ribonuclease HII [Arsenicitalea aurantiaca]RUT31152.1 ribonuclease HII [Arsenicitalea aurantiaca]